MTQNALVLESTNSARMRKNSRNSIVPTVPIRNGPGTWRGMCLLALSPEHSGHAGRTQTGTSAHGFARIVLDAVAAADENVDAVRLREHIVDMDNPEDIVPVRVAVVPVQGGWK